MKLLEDRSDACLLLGNRDAGEAVRDVGRYGQMREQRQ